MSGDPSLRQPPRYLGLAACLVLAAAATGLGLALRIARPVEAPDPAFLARIEAWKALAHELERGHHMERARPR